MNNIRDTVPPPAGIVPSTLPDNDAPLREESTADLKKDAELARLIQEIHAHVGESFVPLRTDIETLSGNIRSLTDALGRLFDNLATLGSNLGTMRTEFDSLKLRLERLPCWRTTTPPPCPLEVIDGEKSGA